MTIQENVKQEIGEIDILIDSTINRKEFKIISPLVEIYDVPGIDDVIDSVEVFSFIEK